MKPKYIYIILGLVIITLLAITFLNNNPKKAGISSGESNLPENSNESVTESNTQRINDTSDTTGSYSTFTNGELGISFLYPSIYKPNTIQKIDQPCVTGTTNAPTAYPEGVVVFNTLKDKHCLSYKITLTSDNELDPNITIKVANPWEVMREMDGYRELFELPEYLFPPTEPVTMDSELGNLNSYLTIEKNVLTEAETSNNYSPISPHYYYRFFIAEKDLGFLIGYPNTYGDKKSQQVVDEIVASIELI